jgi:site-specific DNA-methyltransferase (adenine-specific)
MIDLRCGNCLELMSEIEDGSVDLILTDPPYGTTACKWDSVIPFEPMWEQLNRIIKPNGAICLFGSEPFSSALRMSNIKHFKYDWVWQKDRPTGLFNAKKQPLRDVENICVFYKKQPTYNPQMFIGKKNHKRGSTTGKSEHYETGCFFESTNSSLKYPRTTVAFKREHPPVHPTQKPIALLEYLIKTYTNEGETVLDFTMGSGSTGVACVNTGRNFIGIELDEGYFQIAKERIENCK